jgi:uncharacterized protein involved in outer membrane biogenesis
MSDSNQNAVSPTASVPPHKPWWKRIIRFFAWTSGIVIFLLLILVLLTWVYRDKVIAYVKEDINKRVNTTIIIDEKNIDITIIRSFPDVAVEFNDIALLDAINVKKRDTLFHAGRIALGFNIMDLFHGKYDIHNITVEDAKLSLRIDEKGNDNYHFLKEEADTIPGDSSSSVSFSLEEIILKNTDCYYINKKEKQHYNVDFSELTFSGEFGTEKYEFSTESDFVIGRFQNGKSSLFKGNKGALELVMEIDNTGGVYSVKKGKLNLADLVLNLTGNIKDAGKNQFLDLALKGENVDLPTTLSLLPAEWHKDVADVTSSGEFYIDGTVKGLYGDTSDPVIQTQFGIKSGASIGRNSSSVKLTDVSLKGFYSNEKGKDRVEIESFEASSLKSKFTGSFSVHNFKRPEYAVKLNGNIDLGEIQNFLQIDTIESVSGAAQISVDISGKPKSMQATAAEFRKFKTHGDVQLQGISFRLRGSKQITDSVNGKLSFDGNNISISNFTARKAGSDVEVNGQVRNLLGFLFTETEKLDITGELLSDNLDLNRLLSDEAAGASEDSIYLLELPQRMKLKMDVAIKHVLFRRFEANSVAGTVAMNNQRLTADPISFKAMNGSFSGSGMIESSENDSLLITCNADVRDVNISQLFWQLENFGQEGQDEVITDKNVKGILTSQVNFASVWGKDLEVNERKIYTDAEITINQGELIDFKPLEVLSRFIKLEDLKNIRFKTLSNHIEIRNRIIDIPRMDIHSTAIDIQMWGTHDFDNNVDYHFIVDLDELRAKKAGAAKKENTEFGQEIDNGGHRTRLFISMKGPIDNPEIGYDRKGAIQQVKDDLKQEKQNLTQILNNEFGWFGKDKNKKENRKEPTNTDKFVLSPEEDSTPTPKEKNPKGKGKKGTEEVLDDSKDYE